jgi:hypothetical protein
MVLLPSRSREGEGLGGLTIVDVPDEESARMWARVTYDERMDG